MHARHLNVIVGVCLAVCHGCSENSASAPQDASAPETRLSPGDSQVLAQESRSICGDDQIDETQDEDCDGVLPSGASCQSLGFDDGDLSCGPRCFFDRSGCRHRTCNNGQRDGNEDCEGQDLAGKRCVDLGFEGGTLSCANNCAFDTSGCINDLDPPGEGEARLWEVREWTLENIPYSGNPFDIEATATFTHQSSQRQHTTGLFYAGGNTWKFRFTGTLEGRWDYQTQSTDNASLNAHTGSVLVIPQPDNRMAGFVTHAGKKWTRSANGKAFVPQFVMYAGPHNFHNDPAYIDEHIRTFLQNHGFTGFHTMVLCRWFDINEDNCGTISGNDSNPNPDMRTFDALELLLDRVYRAGGVVHLWQWGDTDRRMNPANYWGGLNSAVDKRLQRYIAARLGPMPGWTMGYGFDLWEWVNGSQLEQWHRYMHQHLGWPHYLGARWEKNQLTQASEVFDYSSYEQHRPTYNDYVRTIETRPEKPSFSEDRFRVRTNPQSKDYSEELTRRGLWHSMMAGGVANIWGNLVNHEAANIGRGSSGAYSNANQLKTYATFSERYFHGDLNICANISDAHCLERNNLQIIILYKEQANSINLSVPNLSQYQTIRAIDTKKAYDEIMLTPPATGNLLSLPYLSDWAIYLVL